MTFHLQRLLGETAGIISLVGFVPYIWEIIRGKTRPNRATWWIWTVVGATLCASYHASGARDSIWVPLTYVIGPLVTAILSIKYGEGGVDTVDRSCLAASILSLPAWWLSGSPLVALIANVAVDLFGAVPTLRKTYYAPREESLPAWSLFLLADFLNLGAIGKWTTATALYPVYLLALAGVMVILMVRPTAQMVGTAKCEPATKGL